MLNRTTPSKTAHFLIRFMNLVIGLAVFWAMIMNYYFRDLDHSMNPAIRDMSFLEYNFIEETSSTTMFIAAMLVLFCGNRITITNILILLVNIFLINLIIVFFQISELYAVQVIGFLVIILNTLYSGVGLRRAFQNYLADKK